MFTIIACVGIALIGVYSDRSNVKDRQHVSFVNDDEVRVDGS